MAGGPSTPAEKAARPSQMTELTVTKDKKLSAAEQRDVEKREAIFTAIITEVREEVGVVFITMKDSFSGSDRDRALRTEEEATIDRFLHNGTTLVSRNPSDGDGAARNREYVLANKAISAKGIEARAEAAKGGAAEQGNEDESQNPLDMYMDGLKVLLAKLFRKVSTKDLGEFDVKVVGADGSDVNEEKRNHFIVHQGMESFIPPAASSKGKE